MKAFNMTPTTPLTAYVKPVYQYAHLPVLTDMDIPSTVLMQVLFKALTMRRASGSTTESQFVAWLCNRLPLTMIDEAGNIHVDIRTSPMHRTMFTSHTDTVHRQGGVNTIRIDKQEGATYWRADEGACLGADDGAGIALMMHMIDRCVPGYYLFFRGEERGGIGSTWLAEHMPEACADIDRCVSFDRADYMDVITHQAGGRCCSDAFAQALASALTTHDLSLAYTPDSTGVFTDSANLTGLIPECTNLSVGYKYQHGDSEWQDVTFLAMLAAQLVQVDWDALPTERDPKAKAALHSYADWATGGVDAWAKDYVSGGGTWKDYPKLDDFEEMVMDALYAAYDEDYAQIRGIVSEWLLPDEPEMARKHVDPRRITSDDYLRYANGVCYGEFDAHDVCDILASDLYKE